MFIFVEYIELIKQKIKMEQFITLKGQIVFDPKDKTKKHGSQSTWKKMAMVMFDGDISEYYAWFLERRYNIKLNKPLRGPHISFINDSINDMKKGLGVESEKKVNSRWNYVKNMWDRKEITIVLDLDMRSDSIHWWLNIPNENRNLLHAIRIQLGLERPYYGLHLSIGYANNKNIEQSKSWRYYLW